VELGKILSGKNDAGEIKDGRLAHLCMYWVTFTNCFGNWLFFFYS
jgi:hypothetical protein